MYGIFLKGVKAMLPITTGIIPFGLVMGTVASNANLSGFQTMTMNSIVFAGASQLAAVDLLTKNAPVTIIIITGLIINLRFLLYSAALSKLFKHEVFFKKILLSYTLTDQSYASLMAHEKDIQTTNDKVLFYIGTSITMVIAWQFSVLLGFIFGNFMPKEFNLDYAVPVSFIALVMPTLKNKKYIYVAILSAISSIVLKEVPYNLGLLISAAIAISLAVYLNRKVRL